MKKYIFPYLFAGILAGCVAPNIFQPQIKGLDAKNFVHDYLQAVYRGSASAAGYECKGRGDVLSKRFPQGYSLATWSKGRIDPELSLSARQHFGGLTCGGIRSTVVVSRDLTLSAGQQSYTHEYSFVVIRSEEFEPLFNPDNPPRHNLCIMATAAKE